MDLDFFERIGLKEKEARVYIALLKYSPSLANQVAKKSGILRSSVYDYLDVLLEKGFATYTIKSGKKFFQATSPEKIIENFEEQKGRQLEALQQSVLELSKLRNLQEMKTKVEVFEGKEGLKSGMNLVLREKPQELLAFGSSGVSYKILPIFIEKWHKERARLGIKLKIIYNNVPSALERLEKGPKMQFAYVKLQPESSPSLAGTLIFNDKVLLTLWEPENPVAILIESATISKSYKENFEVLWKNSKLFAKS